MNAGRVRVVRYGRARVPVRCLCGRLSQRMPPTPPCAGVCLSALDMALGNRRPELVILAPLGLALVIAAGIVQLPPHRSASPRGVYMPVLGGRPKEARTGGTSGGKADRDA